ncbi:MAG: hypothetical protein ACR2LL_01930 [Nitrosopumilus sp.]
MTACTVNIIPFDKQCIMGAILPTYGIFGSHFAICLADIGLNSS